MVRRHAWAMLVAAAGLAAPAAAQDRAESLKGNWMIDKMAAFEASAPPIYKMATPEKQKEMRDKVMATMPDMFIEFTADKATMKAGQETPEVATYKITKREANKVWLDLTSQAKAGATAEVEQFSIEFVDDDTLKMQKEGDPAALTLKRQK